MNYAGRPIKRFEDPHLITGQTAFVDDIRLEGTLHAVVLRSPYAHAVITSIDPAPARRAPGVVAVLTSEDMEEDVRVPSATDVYVGIVDHISAPEHPILAREKVVYVGQPVAVVVAEDPYAARDAAELIDVEYEPLDPLPDPEDAMAPGAPPIHPELSSNIGLRVLKHGGDVDAAFAQADRVVKQRYYSQRLAPVPMEGRAVLASYDGASRLLTLWDSTQRPHWVKRFLALALHLEEDSVRVIAQDVGGGFGEKGCMFPEEISIPYLAIKLGRPVKWVEERQENMTAFHGRGHISDLEAAVKNDGTLLGLRVRTVIDLGAYFLFNTPAAPLNTSHRVVGPYQTPALDVEVLGIITNKPPNGAYRGAGGPEAAFCLERTVDIIAAQLGLDPADVRRKNFVPADAFPYHTPIDVVYDSGNYQAVFHRALDLSGYDAWRQKSLRDAAQGGPLSGVGIASVIKGAGATGARRTEYGRLLVEPSGRVTVFAGISPHGQGTETVISQLVADELGLTPADVHVVHSDTALVSAGHGTGASRGVTVGASAIHTVAVEARQKLLVIAAGLLDCPAEEVVLRDNCAVQRSNPDRSVPFAQIAAAAHNEELLPPSVTPGLDFSGSFTISDNPYSFGAHVVAVEVDSDTGEVRILGYTAVHDVGRILNPLIAEGQVHGAIAQGIGQALMEEMSYTSDGQPLTGSLMDYALPSASDIPPFTLDTFETPSPLNPLGVKGVGEIGTVAAPAAIANAVMDALSRHGITHIDTPLTPDKIWRALHPTPQ